MSLQKYNQLMSDGLSFVETTATRMMAIHMTRTVIEKRPMRMIFIFKAIRLFQSRATGTEMTMDFVSNVGSKDIRRLTQKIRNHVERTVKMEGHQLESNFVGHSTLHCFSQYIYGNEYWVTSYLP
jgi:hypothetical protein